MTEEIRHIYPDSKYEVSFERAALKGIDGFKVKARGDAMHTVLNEARELAKLAKGETEELGKGE